MKRIIALLTVLILAVAVVPAPVSSAADDATEAVIWEDFSRRDPGEKFDDSEIIIAEKEGSATCIETLGAIGGVNAVRFDYTSLRGYHNITGDQGFKLVYNKPRSLKGVSHMIYYVRMPVSRADDAGNNWQKSGAAIMLYLGGYNWAQLKEGTIVQYLPKTGHEWKDIETNGMYLDLPSGFEGYIKIPVDSYKCGNITEGDSIHNYSVQQTILQFSNMGAQCGSAYINAVYGVTKNTDGIMVKLNGEKNSRFYTTGATLDDIKSEKLLLDSAMRAVVLQNYASYPAGYDLVANGLFSTDHKKDVNAKLVEGAGGILGNPLIEISSETLGGFHDSDPYYNIKYPAFTTTEGFQAILFYVKCAGSHPLQPGRATFRFNIATSKNDEPRWTLLGEGKAKYLEKGSNRWKVADSDVQGIMSLPDNFEGYIMADIGELLVSPIVDDLENRTATLSTIQFQAVGGDAGNAYVGGIYAITDKLDRNEMLITFNECEVYSLSDNEYATPADLSAGTLDLDIDYEELPAATSSLKASVSDVTEATAKVTWDAFKGAKNYRVDLYVTQGQAEGEAVTYKCKQSIICNGTELTVDKLEGSTRYYAVVNAMNNSGSEAAVYLYQRFLTLDDGTASPPKEAYASTNEDEAAASVTSSDKSTSAPVLLYIIISVGVAVVIAGAVAAVIIIKKKKGAKK